MLSQKDRQAFKQGIYDLYSEVGTTQLIFHPLHPNLDSSDDIYGEKAPIYLDPIKLIGVISPSEPIGNTLDPIPTMGISMFDVDIPILSLEKANLDPYSMIDGQFEFDTRMYKVIHVVPQGMFTDFYSNYKFKTQML